jgi:hypothetical protein
MAVLGFRTHRREIDLAMTALQDRVRALGG